MIERDAVASVPRLPGCQTRKAISLCLEAEGTPSDLEFVGIQRVTIAASTEPRA